MAIDSGSRTVVILGAAIGFGLLAAFASWMFLASKEKALRDSLVGVEQQMVRVVVARENLPKGLRVSANYLAARNIPAEYVHPNALRPGDIERYEGRFIVETVEAGKPLLTSFLDETFPVDFSDTVESGRRAMTVQVDEVNAIGGHIRPGNYIDLFVTVGAEIIGASAATPVAFNGGVAQSKSSDIILPVLQQVQVLATGTVVYEETLDELMRPQRTGQRRFTNLTLDVSPEQAAYLATAEDKGELLALLRNREDPSFADFQAITPLDLFANANKMQQDAALRAAAEAMGATVDENGNLVLADGTVINKNDIVVGADGSVSTTSGDVLAVVGPDGKVISKDQMMLDAGYTINADGDYVAPDGTVVKKQDVTVLANGTIVGSDGTVLGGPKVTRTKDGFYVDENGNVMTADGQILTGVTVNENGEVVTEDGRVLTDPNLQIAADGTVTDSSGRTIAGVSGGAAPGSGADVFDDLAESFLQGGPGGGRGPIDLIVGGSGKDGVAPVGELPILQ